MGLLQDFLDTLKDKHTAIAPEAIIEEAIGHQVGWAKYEGKESEDQLRERLRAHWPKAVRAHIDHAIERQFHPERRG